MPTEVDVQTSDGNIKAIAYIYANPANLSDVAWDAEEFEKKHKEEFAKQHASKQKWCDTHVIN